MGVLCRTPFRKENRTMSINTQYIVLLKNPRDQIGPAILARQMYPSNSQKFMIKYIEATTRPYGYLFIDLKQNTPEEDRLKTDISMYEYNILYSLLHFTEQRLPSLVTPYDPLQWWIDHGLCKGQ
jgi:hypothetical protein